MRTASAFRLTPGLALMPDIGANQLSQSIEQLTSPSKIVSQFTPALKVPAQLMANKDFYYNQQYKPNDYQRIPPELQALQGVASALGLSQDVPGGGQAVEKKYIDSIYDLLPPLALVNRLASTSPDRAGKGGQGWLNWAGIPIKQINPQVLEGEKRRRQYAQDKGGSAEAARRRALAKLANAS
jgi:hypothetical protein